MTPREVQLIDEREALRAELAVAEGAPWRIRGVLANGCEFAEWRVEKARRILDEYDGGGGA